MNPICRRWEKPEVWKLIFHTQAGHESLSDRLEAHMQCLVIYQCSAGSHFASASIIAKEIFHKLNRRHSIKSNIIEVIRFSFMRELCQPFNIGNGIFKCLTRMEAYFGKPKIAHPCLYKKKWSPISQFPIYYEIWSTKIYK